MKLAIINPQLFDSKTKFLLDLQTAQLEGHRAYPYWTAKYLIAPNQVLVIPEGIFACLTGRLQGVMGSQYSLGEQILPILPEVELKLPTKLEGFPPVGELKGKRVLCVLAHPSLGLGDLILAMPFLKIFAEGLKIKLSLCVNSAGAGFFHGQSWLRKVYPEVMLYDTYSQYDYYLEPAIDKMNVLGWIRSYLLKEFGEKIFYERFPSPELKINESSFENIRAKLNSHPKRKPEKKICLLNWETSSKKRNLPVEILKVLFNSLMIMDYQILVSKPEYLASPVFDWVAVQAEVLDASPFINSSVDLVNLVHYADLTISPDTSFVHFAGSLRKRGLCIFLKSATELYAKTWLKGTYWPGKIQMLYPTITSLVLPNGYFKDMEKIIYSAVRKAAFDDDPEIVEMYNNLFFNLRQQNMLIDLEEALRRKNIDFKKLTEEKLKKANQALQNQATESSE